MPRAYDCSDPKNVIQGIYTLVPGQLFTGGDGKLRLRVVDGWVLFENYQWYPLKDWSGQVTLVRKACLES